MVCQLVVLSSGAWLPQGDGGADSPGQLQGQQAPQEDQEGP